MPPMQKSSRPLQSLLETQNLDGVGEPTGEPIDEPVDQFVLLATKRILL